MLSSTESTGRFVVSSMVVSKCLSHLGERLGRRRRRGRVLLHTRRLGVLIFGGRRRLRRSLALGRSRALRPAFRLAALRPRRQVELEARQKNERKGDWWSTRVSPKPALVETLVERRALFGVAQRDALKRSTRRGTSAAMERVTERRLSTPQPPRGSQHAHVVRGSCTTTSPADKAVKTPGLAGDGALIVYNSLRPSVSVRVVKRAIRQ